MSRKRSRKLPKPKIAPTEPTTYRRLYVKKSGWNDIPLIVFGGMMFLVGISISLQQSSSADAFYKISSWGMVLLGVFLILGVIFWQLESVVISGESLIFSYRLTKKVFKASEVAAIGWQTGLYLRSSRHHAISLGSRFTGDLGPSGDLYGQYGRYSFLSVQLKNGKKAEIPGSPYSHLNIEKPLLAWLERYNPSENENAENITE